MKKLYPSACTTRNLPISQDFRVVSPFKIPPAVNNPSSFGFFIKLALLFLLVFGMQVGFAQAQTNVALGKTVTSSSNLDAVTYPNSNLVDGNFSTFAHTANSSTGTNAEWFMVDLGADYFISSITLGDRPNINRDRRFMFVSFPSAVATQVPGLVPTQGSYVNPINYINGANTSLFNRLIYTDPAGTGTFGETTSSGTESVPGASGSKLGPAFPGNTATVGGQLSLNVGIHKARYIMVIDLQHDYFDPTELKVFEAASPFVRSFTNGGFEQGTTAIGAGTFVRENTVNGWSTTEAVGMNSTISSVPTDGTFMEFWSSGSLGVNARAGNYFVELNAYTNGMLEQQPICVLTGETFTWSFAHRGRDGVDVMALRINDIDVANFSDNNATGGTHTVTVLTSANTTITSQVTDANGWTQYTGTWRNTTGSIQKVTYGYRAVSTASVGVGGGNFLDNVSLSSLSSLVSFSSSTGTGPETVPTANLPKLLITGTTTVATTIDMVLSGTATRGSDYSTPTAATGNVTVAIPAGTYDGTAATGISLAPYININTDLISPEPDETIIMTLTNPSAGLAIGELSSCTNGQNNLTYTITDSCVPATITGPASGCVGGSTIQLTGSDTPATTNPWVSSNTAIATVDNTGLVTPVAAGTTTITYTNNTGCSATKTITINAAPTITGTTNACVGLTSQLTGSATAATTNPWVSSNTAVATVSNTGLVTGVAAGTSIITYTNTNGCSQQVTFTVNDLPTITGTTSVCVASTTQLTGSGTAATTNPWVSSNTAIATVSNTGLVTGVAAGTATITYTNSNGCTKQASITVNALPTITGTTSVCINATTQLTGSGTAATTDPWVSSNTAIATVNNTGLVTGVAAGTATITYTNSNGCSKTFSATVNALPAAPTVTAVQPTCTTATGTITVTAPTGSGLTYSIDGTNYQASTTFNNVASGTYSVTVRNSDGCTSAATSVTIDPQPATPATPTLGAVVQPTSCTPTGSFTITNYSAAYTYTVSPSAGVTVAGDQVTAPVGTYTVSATLGSCTSGASASVTLTRPATLTAVISSSSNVNCFGASTGSATVSVTGGNSPYTYSWNTNPVQTSATANNLAAGTYTVTVTDASGCSTTQDVTITEPAAGLSITGTVINSTCGATNNGAVDITLSGGTTPYTYQWDSGETTQDISNKAAGTYTVTVTDAKSCSTSSSFTVTAGNCQPVAVNDSGNTTPGVPVSGNASTNDTPSGDGGNSWSLIGTDGGATLGSVTMNTDGSFTYTPKPNTSGTDTFTYHVCDVDGDCSTAVVTITIDASTLNISTTGTNVKCYGNNDGSATVTATGGTSPYTYSWNTSPVQTTATANNLAAGTYTVTVTDNVGTIRTENITISQPSSALVANVDIPPVDVKCFGQNTGSATASATGGTGSYTYSWDTSPVQTTATASNLAAGTYTVTVTDANGCTSSKSVTIAQPSAALSINITAQNVICYGSNTGSATASASGGTSPYNYSWNTNPVQASATANNLTAGTYTVTVTDANGCSTTQDITITEPAGPVPAPTATAVQPTCTTATGTITVSAPTGSGYTYSIDGTNYQASTTFTAVTPGNYSVTARNSDGCTSAATNVTINSQPVTPASPTVSAIQPTCTTATGTINVTAQSGTGITYSIDGTNYQASTSFTNVASGSYSVTTRNSDGCTSAATNITIDPQPVTPAAPTATAVQPTCTTATGTITVTAPTGSGLTYSIDGTNYQVSTTFNNVASGTYSVTVRNSDGCTSASSSITIDAQPATPAAPTATVIQPTCTTATGTITVTAPTGSGLTYSIDGTNYQASTDFNNVVSGTYSVTVRN
ncbi:Ig-like domain-containing protein, partial [Pedobacter sp. R20-19]|uniref:Ig-like domain-containing protein n=1 Tax=Pedobacter sp. R20-19 TaxID=1270196 RepID=UPI0018D07D82